MLFCHRSYFLAGIFLLLPLSGCSLFENTQELHLCEEVYVVAEQMPLLEGGMSELQSRVKYPKEAKESGIEGRVVIQFVVDKLGEVRNTVIAQGLSPETDQEALRVVNQATFEPGEENGERVCVQYALPINFRLDN